MVLLVANAATRAWTARLFTARGIPRLTWWMSATASSENNVSGRPRAALTRRPRPPTGTSSISDVRRGPARWVLGGSTGGPGRRCGLRVRRLCSSHGGAGPTGRHHRHPAAATITRSGVQVQVMLADEMVQVKDYGPARQLTLYENDAPVLQVLTSDTTAIGVGLLYWLRARWRIENMFTYAAARGRYRRVGRLRDGHRPVTHKVTNTDRTAARESDIYRFRAQVV